MMRVALMKPRKIDCSLIPSAEVYLLCKNFAEEAEKQWYKNDPEDKRKFEEWRKRKAEQGKIL